MSEETKLTQEEIKSHLESIENVIKIDKENDAPASRFEDLEKFKADLLAQLEG